MLNPSIGAGELCQAIQIQAQTATTDPTTGEPSSLWSTVLTTRAAIYTGDNGPGVRGKQPRTNYQGGQFSSEITHVIKIRWPGPTIALAGGQQVLFGTRTFYLDDIENIQERNRVLLLYCIEINGVQ